MITLSIRSRTDSVERTLQSGGFDRTAFIRAASLVKERVETERQRRSGQSGQPFGGFAVAPTDSRATA